ncbi:Adenylosuccinate synthetase [Methanosarcina mazei Go1]|uniref:Adenylosuccinate synthetase n=1 Tax=Methanosarcina mazei (strain ATCC BAA-159 / DSM 3647 / Goe1 / Go1 / JCM 11833 / OCM 88) TaxID=192952 RepID=PURA_METMA|nr:RecName: Full=Adenylosuccinate synthetase; Short=AMPSase; Short=AdSS; AltName: Full=IMP--aspartate ligase [Methanosarcina mazei Go1]AAM30497.1 Adenylosuccinate synthetase [Methanosarcina mazei Go1]
MFTIITGAQFGDEGKGKIVDLLAKDYDVVARFQGGNNAGHTVKVGDEVYKLHLIPSGILLDARVLIGPGVVLNPEVLAEEIEMFEKHGVKVNSEKLGVDAKTSIIMPYHIELDGLREASRETKIGTTKRGIGYAYIDKVARDEIRMAELVDKERFLARLEELAPQKEKEIEAMGGDPRIVRDPELIKRYLELGEQFAAYITDVSREINQALDEGKNVMAEAAQGTHLDVIHGTQKFVTSSSTIAGSACANLGVGPTRVDNVIAIVKAYITRVGEGPLPTELIGELGERIQKAGGEFGTTTGRGRRCGWFDLPLLKKAIALNGYTEISLTKLDVLTGLDPLRSAQVMSIKGKNWTILRNLRKTSRHAALCMKTCQDGKKN